MDQTRYEVPRQPSGGRGARERIMAAAGELFYRHGINSTGMEQLTAVAHVSKRSFYQHFSGKDELIAQYLQRWEESPRLTPARLDRTDLPPRERLLSAFADPADVAAPRGCPFHNAAVELPAGDAPSVPAVHRYKALVRARLAEVAAEAGARDPEALGGQLAVLLEGAGALATSVGNAGPYRDARAAAAALITVQCGPA
jgi:AcrR family transcriptional regulator